MFPQLMYCLRLERYEDRSFKTCPLTPQCSSLESKILGSTSNEGVVISKPQEAQINYKRSVATNDELRAENSKQRI